MCHNSARDQRKSGRGTVAGRQRQRQRWRMRPTVVVLEDRRLLSTFTVTNNASSGAGSLPYEIGLANTVLELRFLTPPDQIAARYSLGCDCRSCLASTFRPVGVSIFSASSFSSRCSAS